MTLNKSKGNMYPFVNYTWNPIKGRCPYDCDYCYVKRFPVGKLRLDEKCLKDNLGNNNIIFVGSSCDMFADKVPDEWILDVLSICNKFPKNIYLFQSKNPKRFINMRFAFPKKCILGTTIETNNIPNSYAPIPKERYEAMKSLQSFNNTKRMVSIEPIMIFDLDVMIKWIKDIKLEFVSIGADSKGYNLPEPSKEEIKKLIKELRKFTEVKIKDNLKRLYDTKTNM